MSALAVRRFRKWNVHIDARVRPLRTDELPADVAVEVLDVRLAEFRNWLRGTSLPFRTWGVPRKKALEFFFSQYILAPSKHDHVLDAAGGRSGYLDAIRTMTGCQHLYLTDHIYSGIQSSSTGIYVVGGDIAAIELPPKSVTRIACHHAFEHFQAERDSGFIREIGRLLADGGRACILPVFLTHRYVECWNVQHEGTFDPRAELLVDTTASTPGGKEDGHFARFYDLQAFRYRVLAVAEQVGLISKIVNCRIGGRDVPDMKKNFGSAVNRPLRALVLEK